MADAEGYDATYINPAGLIEPTHRRLTLGYVHGWDQLNLDETHHPIDPANGILLGANLPLPLCGVRGNTGPHTRCQAASVMLAIDVGIFNNA